MDPKKRTKWYGVFKEEDGAKRWRKDGRIHRENGPAVIEKDGWKRWYLNGVELTLREWERVRDNAETTLLIERDTGDIFWFKGMNLHNERGVAAVWAHGRTEWWLEGTQYSELVWKGLVEQASILVNPSTEGIKQVVMWEVKGEIFKTEEEAKAMQRRDIIFSIVNKNIKLFINPPDWNETDMLKACKAITDCIIENKEELKEIL